MNLALIVLICIGSVFHQRGFLLFGAGMLLHWWGSAYITSDIFYYVSDALMLVCISEILRLASHGRVRTFMLIICGLGAITDAIGIILWFNYSQPLLYNNMYTVIYLTVLCAMVMHGRGDTNGRRVFGYRAGVHPCRSINLGNNQ